MALGEHSFLETNSSSIWQNTTWLGNYTDSNTKRTVTDFACCSFIFGAFTYNNQNQSKNLFYTSVK